MKVNPGMSLIFLSNKKAELLGITLDLELKFEKHITGICNKASQKIHVLSRIKSHVAE